MHPGTPVRVFSHVFLQFQFLKGSGTRLLGSVTHVHTCVQGGLRHINYMEFRHVISHNFLVQPNCTKPI